MKKLLILLFIGLLAFGCNARVTEVTRTCANGSMVDVPYINGSYDANGLCPEDGITFNLTTGDVYYNPELQLTIQCCLPSMNGSSYHGEITNDTCLIINDTTVTWLNPETPIIEAVIINTTTEKPLMIAKCVRVEKYDKYRCEGEPLAKNVIEGISGTWAYNRNVWD